MSSLHLITSAQRHTSVARHRHDAAPEERASRPNNTKRARFLANNSYRRKLAPLAPHESSYKNTEQRCRVGIARVSNAVTISELNQQYQSSV
jgi:hypothetical protein